ncbi:MAG: SDR family NAD(P)-dependent oxidoreductase, partial [Candidatus Heimdallarchaeota archaeon]
MELGESGVRVNCICPGFIITPMIWNSDKESTKDSNKIIERLKPVYANYQPIRRAGLPKDIAQAVLWLASDDSSFINGHALIIDGGLAGGHMWSDRLKDNEQLQSIIDSIS